MPESDLQLALGRYNPACPGLVGSSDIFMGAALTFIQAAIGEKQQARVDLHNCSLSCAHHVPSIKQYTIAYPMAYRVGSAH